MLKGVEFLYVIDYVVLVFALQRLLQDGRDVWLQWGTRGWCRGLGKVGKNGKHNWAATNLSGYGEFILRTLKLNSVKFNREEGSQGTVLCKEAIVDLSSKQYKLKKQCADPLGAIDAVFHEARGEQHSLDILVRCLGNPYNSVSQLS